MSHDCNCHGSDHRMATTVIGQIERPLYAPGLILQDSDLTAAIDYTRELNRLLFRTLFGCGVICGLRIGLRENCGLTVSVAPGLALDGCGDPLHLPGPATIKLDERDVLSPAGTNGRPANTRFWILACGKERRCAPRSLVCDDSLDDIRQATRARSATEISVTFERPDCACAFSPDIAQSGSEERSAQAKRDAAAEESKAKAASAAGGAAAAREETKESQSQSQPAKDAARTSADCPDDCGCGSACDCGCCVLLGQADWNEETGWAVSHKGVRRFVRPQLIDDPIDDQLSAAS